MSLYSQLATTLICMFIISTSCCDLR